jgi:hypothetical protein
MRNTISRPGATRRIALLLIAATSLGACAVDTPTAPMLAPALHLATAAGQGEPGCHPDSKLIGRIELSTNDAPGTWWYITRQGFDASGVTDYRAFIESLFGQAFATLDDAISFLVNQVRPLDENGNGYVCAYSTRGTRANYGQPGVTNFLFSTTDDDHPAR